MEQEHAVAEHGSAKAESERVRETCGAEWSGLLELALLAVMMVTVAKAMVVIAEQQQQQQLKRAIAPTSRARVLQSGTAARQLQRRAFRRCWLPSRRAAYSHPKSESQPPSCRECPPMIGLVIGGHGCLQICKLLSLSHLSLD